MLNKKLDHDPDSNLIGSWSQIRAAFPRRADIHWLPSLRNPPAIARAALSAGNDWQKCPVPGRDVGRAKFCAWARGGNCLARHCTLWV